MSDSAGFMMLVPARPGARTLEVSEGGAFAAQTLRSAGCTVTCVRGSEEHTAALRREGFEVVVAGDDAGLARIGVGFDIVLLSMSLGRTRGTERIVRDVPAISRACACLLAPGGRLVVFVPNPAIAPLIERLFGEAGSPRGPLVPRWSSASGLCRMLSSEGFTDVEALAALPTTRLLKFLVPLDGKAGAALFFRSLVSRSPRAVRRIAVRLAAIAASHGALPLLAPAFGIVASKAPAR